MKRFFIALIAGASVFAIAFAAAATLNVQGGTIQAGTDTSLYCDVDGVQANWGLETDDNTVRSVRITGIDAACEGNELFVKVRNGTGTLLAQGSAVAPAGGGQVTVAFPSPWLDPSAIEQLQIWIEGPSGV